MTDESQEPTPQAGPPIVVAFPTIMDGLVVRWYRSLRAAEIGNECISASRNAVSVRDEHFETLPNGWLVMAMNAHRWLANGDEDAVKDLATHHSRFASRGRSLTPIERPA